MYRLSLSGGTSPVSFKNSLLSTVLFRSMLDYTGFGGSSETILFPATLYLYCILFSLTYNTRILLLHLLKSACIV